MSERQPVNFDLGSFRSPPGYRGRSSLFVLFWWFIQATLFTWSPQPLFGFRRFLLRAFGARIGKGVLIRPSVRVVYPWKLTVGDHSWVGDEAVLYCLDNIIIGAHSIVSQRCYIAAGSHDYTRADFPLSLAPVRIGDSCWLATDVFVSPGVEIAPHVVVGARSSVFKSITEPGVYFGTPAKKKD
ncbi:WcaF family extracellular polysaccharide biosynthesis acetyltransferase [Pseudomonas sp. LRF_L74]|uniref:WcaF family extracellular polysaccharide biosynthesis acetyltransferase n=1 Tax=Pseudomonas sp. LRF_L74 TaxID=3369422 RepID=UPI003F5D93AC